MATPEIVKADVLAFAPELTTVPGDAAWVDILAYVNTHDLALSGDDEDTARLARIYLAAHLGLMTKRAGSGAAGPVTAESAGLVRRAYGLLAQAAGANSLAGTMYGQLYLALLGSSSAHGPFLI